MRWITADWAVVMNEMTFISPPHLSQRKGSTEIEYEGVTYHQFDMVFFEQVEDKNGNAFYEVVDAPGEDEVTELE